MNHNDADSVLASPEVNKWSDEEADNDMSDQEHNVADIALSMGLSSDAEANQQPSEVLGEVQDNGGNGTVSETPKSSVITLLSSATTPTTADSREQEDESYNADDIALSTGRSPGAEAEQQPSQQTGEVKDDGDNETVSETPVITPSSLTTTTPTTVDSTEQEDESQPSVPTITVNNESTDPSTTVKGDSSMPTTSTLLNEKDNESSSQLSHYPSHSSDDKTEAEPTPAVLGAAASSLQTSPESHTKKKNLWQRVAKVFKPWKWRKKKSVDIKYSKHWVGQFKRDYIHHGKFNLDIQVPHLARLAEFYVENYRRTENWTDCVRAHALYNSISCRKPEFVGWKKQAFSVQQEYLGYRSSFTFEQQQKLTASLKKDLEAIRNESREKMKPAHVLVDKVVGNSKPLFRKMQAISVECSDYMVDFSSRIISESVEILKPVEPPCHFEAVAMGSLARGEATPYSDLEYLFLVEDKLPATVEYFKKLAITTYFQIANLGETKLAYVAIKELDGWFEDKAMNGFKIDGLSDKAGNIPTGNGSPGQHNHFIVTPEELGAKYHDVLDNPRKETALRGDITSMLAYLRLIYTHDSSNKDLLGKLQERIQSFKKNQKRQDINVKMLKTDVKKFNFVPDHQLYEKGNAADVKREIYRFPSILLLDLNVVTNTAANNSWESLITLCDNNHISTELKSVLELLLAAAAYMRLSAYLFHDSQDDRISVSPGMLQSLQTPDPKLSRSQQRWFVPQGIFIAMCVKLIMLKEHLARTENMANSFQSLALADDDTWPRITALYYSGMHREALVVLKQLYGDYLCDDPLSAIQKLPPGQSDFNILSYISETLYWCDEYRAALSLYKHMTDNSIEDNRLRIADCYIMLADNNKAVKLLESITKKTADVHYSLGNAYNKQKEYKKSENAYLQALKLFYADVSSEKQYDYYGDLIQTDEAKNFHKISFTTISSPEERLSRIINISPNVISCVESLGSVYNEQGQYTLAESYYKKSLYLISELYGEGAAVPNAATTLNNLGINCNEMGQYSEAEDSYKQALAIHRKLSKGADNSDIGDTLNNLGVNYRAMGKYDEAENNYKQALAIYRNLSQGADSSDIARTLNNLGSCYQDMGQYSEAEDNHKQALSISRNLSKGADSSDIASVLNNLGNNCMCSGQNNRAEEYLKDSLAMKRKLALNITDIGVTLINLTMNSRMMGQENRAYDYREQTAADIRDVSDADLHNVLQNFIKRADDCWRDGQFIEAEEFYKHCLIMSRRLSSGADSNDTADILQKLGDTYRAAGDESKAVESYREALDMYMRVDPDNQSIRRMSDYLSERIC